MQDTEQAEKSAKSVRNEGSYLNELTWIVVCI